MAAISPAIAAPAHRSTAYTPAFPQVAETAPTRTSAARGTSTSTCSQAGTGKPLCSAPKASAQRGP